MDPDGTITVAYDLIASIRGGFTWDPAEVRGKGDDSLFYMVYGRLMRPTWDGELIPDLAESARVIDRNTIEVTLRRGLTFSDGTAFEAAAVKAGLERSLSSGAGQAFGTTFFDLESVDVVDAISLRLSVPNGTAHSWFDTYMGSWETTIVKPGATDFTRPVGAGPMVVTEFAPERSAQLERNRRYWDADSIQIGGIDLVGVSANDHQAAVNALAAGQVDMAPADVALIPAVGPGNDVLVVNTPHRLMNFQVCKRDGPLADPDVRRAINKAIDREAINEAVFDGMYTVAEGLWPADHRFHDLEAEDAVSYDPDAARRLLREAGYPDGFTFDAYVLQEAGMPEVAQVAQQQLEEVGITMELVPAPDYIESFLGPQRSGVGLVPSMSPNRLKLDQWSGDSLSNTCGYDDPELDRLRAELGTVSDGSDEAAEIWHRIERKVVAEDALSVFLLFASNLVGYNTSAIGDVEVLPTTTQLYLPDPRVAYATVS